MRILLIETSTERGVVAYADGQTVLFEKQLPFGLNQSKFLMPVLQEALQAIDPAAVDAIGVGIGPGSYTGIRIGVAVAQALAYSWKVPLVGIPSLNGFVPLENNVSFAALIDARIGGVYLRKGWKSEQGILYQTEPVVCAWEEVLPLLECVHYFVTPVAKSLQSKFNSYNKENPGKWQESAPSVLALLNSVQLLYSQGKQVMPPQQLSLLYLRETEAERMNRKGKLEFKVPFELI